MSHSYINKTSNKRKVISWEVMHIQSKYISGNCFRRAKLAKQPLYNLLQELTFYLGLWT